MHDELLHVLALLLILVHVTVCQDEVSAGGQLHVSNLNSSCMRCLCFAATSCMSPGCRQGYCGPFYISRIYWADADRFVFQQDTKERDKAWEDCALDYGCATQIVTRYMRKFGQDCNDDGVTDCDDFASLHYNGGFNCGKQIRNSNFGRRYLECRDTLMLHGLTADAGMKKRM